MTEQTNVVGVLRAYNSETRRLELEAHDGEIVGYLMSKFTKIEPQHIAELVGFRVSLKIDTKRDFVNDVLKVGQSPTEPPAATRQPATTTRSTGTTTTRSNGKVKAPDTDRKIVRQNSLSHATTIMIAATGGACTPDAVTIIAEKLEAWILRPVE